MQVIVLVKQTFDTEEKVSIRDGVIVEDGVKFVINPYDEYAIEEAIRLRELHGGSVAAVTVGNERSADALRTALAIGADEAVLIEQPPEELDEAVTAKLLAAYITTRSYDMVIGGNFSVDRGSGQVAIRLAQLLGLPHVGAVTKLEAEPAAGKAIAVRDAEGDDERVEVTLPACFTAQQGLNEPRYPTLPGIVKAKKKPLARVSPEQLGLSPEDLAPPTLVSKLLPPPVRKAGRLLEGDAAAQASELVRLLREQAKLI